MTNMDNLKAWAKVIIFGVLTILLSKMGTYASQADEIVLALVCNALNAILLITVGKKAYNAK